MRKNTQRRSLNPFYGYPAELIKENQPYLECHHVKRLADGGDDAISNAVALCANCHRRMHVLDKDSDRRTLFNRIQERD
ncbi:MAG: HNH endonuclease [Proteobacteria bacterium]|nr:HNH endonuclease [Pseudomonadota bacterium]